MNKKAYISPELVIEDVELETMILDSSVVTEEYNDRDSELGENEWDY